jgi:hypothetical protein
MYGLALLLDYQGDDRFPCVSVVIDGRGDARLVGELGRPECRR